jgi:hypothetical protein
MQELFATNFLRIMLNTLLKLRIWQRLQLSVNYSVQNDNALFFVASAFG